MIMVLVQVQARKAEDMSRDDTIVIQRLYSCPALTVGSGNSSLSLQALSCALLCLGSASRAQAGTAIANLTVQMTITASCTINVATLDFGPIPGTILLAANVDAATTVSVTCTSGSPYSVGMDNGANVNVGQRRMKSGANYLNYNLYTDSGRTAAWTTAASPAPAPPRTPAFSVQAAVLAVCEHLWSRSLDGTRLLRVRTPIP